MNKSRAKNISITEMGELLPAWFCDNFKITFRLLSTNAYIDFQRIKNFLIASLTHLMPEEKDKIEIKHVLVDVSNKGIKDNRQYITVDLYIVLPDGEGTEILRITKSCKVKLRDPLQKLD